MVAAIRERRRSKDLSEMLQKSYYNVFLKVTFKVKVSENLQKIVSSAYRNGDRTADSSWLKCS